MKGRPCDVRVFWLSNSDICPTSITVAQPFRIFTGLPAYIASYLRTVAPRSTPCQSLSSKNIVRCHNDAVTAPATRLTLVSHARTDAMRSGRFPADEPLDEAGVRALAEVTDFPRADRVVSGPELRSRSTAEIFGTDVAIEPALADVAYGRWSGLEMTDLPDADAMAWLGDPAFTPPGGESLDALFARVEAWLDEVGSTPGRTLAVTAPAVIRAAVVLVLAAPVSSFWRVDVAPLTRTSIHRRGSLWTMDSVAQKSL